LWKRPKRLAADRIRAARSEFPSWKVFEEQTAKYKASVPAGGSGPKLRVRGGRDAWAGGSIVGLDGDVIGVDRFGASAPGPVVLEKLDLAWRCMARAKKLVK